MSQTFYDAQGNPVDPAEVGNQGRMAQLPRKVVRRLEKEAEEGREAKARLAQLERERAFVQAGIPIEDKRAAYFIAGYQGDQTPDAIKQEWQATFGSTPGSQSPTDQELNALQGAHDFVTGGTGTPPDQLAQRNAELAALSNTDPLYPQKFDAIMAKYGGAFGALH